MATTALKRNTWVGFLNEFRAENKGKYHVKAVMAAAAVEWKKLNKAQKEEYRPKAPAAVERKKGSPKKTRRPKKVADTVKQNDEEGRDDDAVKQKDEKFKEPAAKKQKKV